VTPGAPSAGSRAEPAALPPAAVPPSVSSARARACLDCGAPLSGKFCAVCGQKDEPLKRGLKDLALEFFQHPLIDTKLWRTMVPLLLRPGALTDEYLAGRRTRYVRPFKLYLTISVVFFALLALMVPTGAVKVQVGRGARITAVEPTPEPEPKERMHLPFRWLDERFQRKAEALEGPGGQTFAQEVGAKTTHWIPKMIFVLLPISAVLLKLFWWRRYFVEHLVCTLHLHTYAFSAGMLLFLRWPPVDGVFAVWSTVYLALALKRVYRQGWAKTLAKLIGLTVAYTVLFSVAMMITAFSALLTD
jgi:hypothetical protein